MWSRISKSGALLILVVISSLVFDVSVAHAERRRVFGRRPSSVNQGNGNVFVNTGTQIPGFASLAKIANNEFQINANGKLGVREQRSDGLQQDIFLQRDGRIFGGAGLPLESRTLQDLSPFLSGGRNRSNRPGRIDAFVARQTGNVAGVNGQMVVDLSSILNKFDPSMKAGTPKQLEFALAVLNQTLNALSNNSTLMRVFPRNIRRDANGKPVVSLNLNRFFSQQALNILASSDPTFRCTGKIRLQALAATAFAEDNYYKIKGIDGFNRDQIFNALGVEPDPKKTLNNKILIAGDPGQEKAESGVTTSSIGRVSKFMNANRIPGATCYETDDFIDRSAPGGATNGRDVKQVGILYTRDASEVLCHQRNGYMLGMLFNAAGVIQKSAPAEIAIDNSSGVGPAVSAAISCMGCHSKGFLGGGRKIHHDPSKLYKDNFNSLPNTATAFVDQFGRSLRQKDFFTTNRRYRERANRDTSIFFRALARSGGLIVETDGPNKGYPQPVVPQAVAAFQSPPNQEVMAAELGVSETALKNVVGSNPGFANRTAFDNAFCGLRARMGGGGANSFAGDRGQTRGSSVAGNLGFQQQHRDQLAAGTTGPIGR